MLPSRSASRSMLSVAIAIGLFQLAAAGQNPAIWNGGTGNWFQTPTSWTCFPGGYSCPPPSGAGSDVNIGTDTGNGPINGTVFLDMPVTVNSVTLGDGAQGTLNVSGSNTLGASLINVGNLSPGVGTLNVCGGGLVSDSIGYIGVLGGSVGYVNVSGTGSQWNTSGFNQLYIGDYGQGTLSLSNGGVVSSYGALLGFQSGSSGTVTVAGVGSQWNNAASMYLGTLGQGTLTVQSGGAVNNTFNLEVAPADANGNGTVLVTGAGSQLNIGLTTYLGEVGQGTLTIQNGGVMNNSGDLIVASNAASGTGAVTVTGVGSQLNNGGGMYLGVYGQATLTIQAGGVVNNNYIFVLADDATVTGVGSQLNIGDTMYLGVTGQATLTIQNGGVVSSNGANIGYQSGTTGTVTVTGAGSQWTNAGGLIVGDYGQGALTVQNGGGVSAAGLDIGGGGLINIQNGSSLWVAGSVDNSGGISTGLGSNVGGNSVTITGTLTIEVNGSLIVDGPGDTASIGGLSNLSFVDADRGSVLQVNGNVDNSGTMGTGFLGSGGSSLIIGGTLTNESGALVAALTQGDVIDVGQLNNNGSVIVRTGATLNLTNQPLGITDVVAGSFFDLFGTFNAGSKNGFYQLTSVESTLILENGQTTTSTPIGGTFTVGSTGYVEVKTGTTFNINGNVTVNSGGIFSVNDPFPTTVNITGMLTNLGGQVNVIGPSAFLNVGGIGNGGTLSLPEGSTVNLSNGFYQLASGTLGEAIGANGFAIIAVNGGLVLLDGTLDVLLDPGFNPAVGSMYKFFTFNPGALSGMFASIQNDIFNGGAEKWVLIYNNSGGYVELVAASATPEPTSLLLLGSGLMVGIGVVRRKRSNDPSVFHTIPILDSVGLLTFLSVSSV